MTAQIWLMMLTDLLAKGIKQFESINEAIDEKESWKHVMPYHVMVLTQTQAGYKKFI